MSIQYAQDLVRRLGPGSITLDRGLDDALAIELALMGCIVHDIGDSKGQGGAALLDWSEADGGATTLAQAASFETLALRSGQASRRIVEPALFAAGWRRHPGSMLFGSTAEWADDRLPPTSYYQRAAHGAADSPMTGSDGKADGFFARYAMASQIVRAGDRVLVDGRHAQEGAEILAALSRADSVIAGVAPAPEGEIFRLDHLDDQSIDLIVAFEPEADDWQIALAEYARVLRLDGRVIIGWPAKSSRPGTPPDWTALADFAGQIFLPERRYAQHENGRAMFPVDLSGPHSEWLILIASAEPLDGAAQRDAFTHPGFPDSGPGGPVLTDFRSAYDNPWLYRTMVQMGERLSDPVKLAQLAEAVIADSWPDSADRGAALGVLGYRVLELRMRDAIAPLIERIEGYFDATQDSAAPHVVRWRISLAFLAGRLAEMAEQPGAALGWYDRCATADWRPFSPILATKTVGACFYGARLCLAARDMDGARTRFQRGVETGLAVTTADHQSQMIGGTEPLPFYFQELAEVLDMASQCTNALANLPLFDRDPGLYWRQVDVRRFGLASWALDMQRENDRLRQMLVGA